jgi:hypothetical protein
MLGSAYSRIFHVKDSSWRIQERHSVSVLDTQHFHHFRGLRGKWEPLQCSSYNELSRERFIQSRDGNRSNAGAAGIL